MLYPTLLAWKWPSQYRRSWAKVCGSFRISRAVNCGAKRHFGNAAPEPEPAGAALVSRGRRRKATVRMEWEGIVRESVDSSGGEGGGEV